LKAGPAEYEERQSTVNTQLGILAFDLREFSVYTPIQNNKHAKGYMKLRKLNLIAVPHPFYSLKRARVCDSLITQFLTE
jgi:hypothetical protein